MAKKKSLQEHVTAQKKKKSQGTWKGGKRGHTSYEGQQYAGGRVKGRKNLTKLDNGNLLNQHGVEFTVSERKALESAVNRTNRKRKQMLAQEADLPRMVAGKETGQNVGQLQLMGKESDFIIARRSKSLQRFKTREDYEKYMKQLETINSPTYLDDRIRLYKRNHMKALENAYGDDAKDVIMKIRMMKPKDYMEMVQRDESLEVSFVYDPSDRTARLNQMRAALGMRLKDDSGEEDYE